MSERASKKSRRQLCAGWLRYGTLGVLVAAGGLTVAKRRRLVNDEVCINNGTCRDCTALAQCGLPQASDAREGLEKGNDGSAK